MRVFLKLAGGGDPSETNLEAFMEQAREYESSAGPLDTIYKVLNILAVTHPFHTLRAGELQRWISGGDYARILQGEYTRRGAEEQERPLMDDIGEAAGHYAREARTTMSQVADQVGDAAKRAASAFTQAFKDAGKK